MFKIEETSGRVVAGETQQSIAMIDKALISAANLCASIVEASNSSSLPVNAPQAALSELGEGLSMLIAGRQRLGSATLEMIKIQKASNLEAVSFGCPDGNFGFQAHPSTATQDA
ncbi:hypothetical protein Q9K02_13360 [Qipengyuania sp. G39]|uniref:Uncharacterized protein n=1 Tax=Qipengyuania profundimaris TaxID=3067652 RepID=A0ABT9HSZ4_9SPHN|nr:hypothetical protein [Qipengyuania sp. G39]MDP4576125.1 hypothetical protein [Qipengyuania sp. G39]